uniref:Reverse transcriptase domain-containing protein n=1 Tax=Tanacetum cinerariifolium TaxID=118510 RepID=A0A6L2LKD5_TANCI|nr:reverse transcriptase domain-containing protein [Tanacetum cinerariifolium]
MSAMANTTPIMTTVTKSASNPRDADATPRVNIQNLCKEYYEDILPIIMDKVRRDNRKEVHARLDFEEGSRERRTRECSHYSSARTLSARTERLKVRDRLRYNDRHVLDRLGHRRQSAFDRLSKTYSPSTTKSRPDRTSSRDRSRGRSRPHRRDSPNGDSPESRDCFRGVGESYGNSHSSYGTGINHGYRYHDRDRSRHTKRGRESESPLSHVSKSDSSDEVDPFTPQIRNFKSSRKTRMPNNVKTYDGTGDPEDHVKIFQAAAQVKRWAMPTWCHMFNSTLIGAARVWFDELPPESVDGYKDLKAAFLAYFIQQKKYVKDPVEIHNIKEKDGETIEDFMERFKVETGRMKGAPECMRISGFMHGVNNPELTKHLNEHVPKTMEEMMITTTAFIRGEAAAASKRKPREGRGSSRFTPLTRTPKEILAAEAGKFQPPPPMVTPVEKRRNNKFCDFHNDKGYSTDECMQLKKQIEALVRAGKLSHLIKEIKQGRDPSKVGKKEAPAKDKPTTIYMIQSWQRMTRQKVTQSFERVREITFPSLATSSGTERPLVIEAKISGHMIHRMYMDGGSSTEVLYEHCFNRLRPKVKNQVVPATTSLTGFSGETIWPLGQLRLLVTIGDADHSTRAWMNFMIVRMLKFPTDEGIVTIRSTILIPAECAMVTASSKEIPKEAAVRHENFKVALHLNFPDQEPSDMTGVSRSVAEHRLNIREGYSPVRQKKRGQALERAKAIQVEDCYPLPEIDWKVESLCGYHFKCFLDAYKGYHQIQLVESDEEKTAFHTGQGVYCYTKMPFDLKNAGATYQRLVDKAFDSQIGRNIEVYIDDLVIKSHTDAEMLRDIGETFRTLRKTNMKLNPKKYTFEAMEGMFLGYMITPEGIKLCPDKTKTVLQLPSPQTIKEVQSLNGKLASLNRSFLSQQKTPKLKEELIVYLSASYGAISAVLMTERGMVQMPVYFISRALQGPKLNYTSMEKLVLSLVLAAKRLRSTDGSVKCTRSVGSKFVANQVLGAYVAKEENMIKYLEKIKSLVSGFPNFSTNYVPQKNKKADALSKIASTSFAYLSRSWRSFLTPWLRCFGPLQEDYVIREIHEGSCSMHAGPWSVVAKAIRLGYYWPTMHRDARNMIPVIPIEIGMPTYRTAAVDVVHNDEELQLNLDFLEEQHERVAIRKAKAKLKMTKYYNARVCGVTFRPGDFVYRSNDASHAVDGGKLCSR